MTVDNKELCFTIAELEDVFNCGFEPWIESYLGEHEGEDFEIFKNTFERMKYQTLKKFFTDEEIKERNEWLEEEGCSLIRIFETDNSILVRDTYNGKDNWYYDSKEELVDSLINYGTYFSECGEENEIAIEQGHEGIRAKLMTFPIHELVEIFENERN